MDKTATLGMDIMRTVAEIRAGLAEARELVANINKLVEELRARHVGTNSVDTPSEQSSSNEGDLDESSKQETEAVRRSRVC